MKNRSKSALILAWAVLLLSACMGRPAPLLGNSPPAPMASAPSGTWRIEGLPLLTEQVKVASVVLSDNMLTLVVTPESVEGAAAPPFRLKISPWPQSAPLPDCGAQACSLSIKTRMSPAGPTRLLIFRENKRPVWWLGQNSPLNTVLPGGWIISGPGKPLHADGPQAQNQPAPPYPGRQWVALRLSPRKINTAARQKFLLPGQRHGWKAREPALSDTNSFVFLLLGAHAPAPSGDASRQTPPAHGAPVAEGGPLSVDWLVTVSPDIS